MSQLYLVQEGGGEPGDLPKIDFLRNAPQNHLHKAPDLCHHGQIMIFFSIFGGQKSLLWYTANLRPLYYAERY